MTDKKVSDCAQKSDYRVLERQDNKHMLHNVNWFSIRKTWFSSTTTTWNALAKYFNAENQLRPDAGFAAILELKRRGRKTGLNF